MVIFFSKALKHVGMRHTIRVGCRLVIHTEPVRTRIGAGIRTDRVLIQTPVVLVNVITTVSIRGTTVFHVLRTRRTVIRIVFKVQRLHSVPIVFVEQTAGRRLRLETVQWFVRWWCTEHVLCCSPLLSDGAAPGV